MKAETAAAKLDWEIELDVVIGKRSRYVTVDGEQRRVVMKA